MNEYVLYYTPCRGTSEINNGQLLAVHFINAYINYIFSEDSLRIYLLNAKNIVHKF